MSDSMEKEETYLMKHFNCMQNPDDIKHSFILSFYFLLKAKPRNRTDLSNLFARCTKLVIAQGGNIALNCAIV